MKQFLKKKYNPNFFNFFLWKYPDYDLDITFLKNQFIEMYDKLKQYSECPVCYETLTKSNIEVPKCGHLICKSCVEKIKRSSTPVCPNCRKKY